MMFILSGARLMRDLQKGAIERWHCTIREAVEVAKKMKAKHVILTHFCSHFYDVTTPLPQYLFDAGNVCMAKDFMVARFNELEDLPKLLPLYKQLYSRELAKLDRRDSKEGLDQHSTH